MLGETNFADGAFRRMNAPYKSHRSFFNVARRAASILFFAVYVRASEITFTPVELFRVPFGNKRGTLGAKIEGGNFIFPRDFTIDEDGHFYINDINNHRIARYSWRGAYEIGYTYPATAKQVFSHADSHKNLWLLISDPTQGSYYGVHDSNGKNLRSAVFSRFNHFRLHLDDDSTLHVILTSDKEASAMQTYIIDAEKLLLKKETIARPPDTHHQWKKSDKTYFIDQVPDGATDDARHVNHITDESHHSVADIQGSVIYLTESGDIYTRLGEREIRIYDIEGNLKGKVQLTGLASAASAIRFDADGNIYELDGIPDQGGRYSSDMPGLRLIRGTRG